MGNTIRHESVYDEAWDAFAKAIEASKPRARGNVIERKGATLYTVRRSELDELRAFDATIEGR